MYILLPNNRKIDVKGGRRKKKTEGCCHVSKFCTLSCNNVMKYNKIAGLIICITFTENLVSGSARALNVARLVCQEQVG